MTSPTAIRKWALAIFLAAITIGVVMRLNYVGWLAAVPFEHLLHAHSHALYFGWAGLVLLTAAAMPPRLVGAAAILVPVMAFAFLYQGYGPISIAISTTLMLVWYAAIFRWWRRSHTSLLPPPTALARQAMRVGFGYVVVASFGIWVLAPLQAAGHGDSLAARLSIHAFLSNFAWFFVIGAAALVLDATGTVSRVPLSRVLWWWAGLAWISFPLGVVGGPEVPWLGPVSRVAGIALAYPAWLWIRHLWAIPTDRNDRWALAGAALWLGMKTVADVAVAIGGTPVLEAVGRHGVVIYLHALLLGYVTTVLIWHLARHAGVVVALPLAAHHGGVAVMIIGLAIAATPGWRPTVGLWMAAVGAAMVWLAGWGWALPIWRRLGGQRRETTHHVAVR